MSLGLLVLAPLLAAAPAQQVSRTVGSVRFVVDTSTAFPGGLLVVHLQSSRALGSADALLDGRRSPFYGSTHGPRALVPVALSAAAGPTTLGFEIVARTGRQRVPLDIALAPATYPDRTVTIPPGKRPLVMGASVVRDGRELLKLVRTETLQMRPGPLKPPVAAVAGVGFGSVQNWLGSSPVEALFDATYGDQHRGLDYEVPLGTTVFAPGAGVVLFAGPLALAGEALVIDHGQGVVSVLCYLARIDPRLGDSVEAGARVGLSGETGLAVTPQVHWRVYVHGIAVDPRVLDRSLD